MSTRPRDLTDLYLAPVALELDRRLAAMADQSTAELDAHVALRTDQQPMDAASRRSLMLEALAHLMPTHGWLLFWDDRGLRLDHGEHSIVLGVPDALRDYVATDV